MKLTKKFIKENAEMTLKEAFPEVFENVLEVGKWYKYNDTLFNYQKNGNIYGFLRGVWKNDNNWFWNNSIGVELATPQEIQDALEKEAVRRYKINDSVFDNWSNCKCRINQLTRFDFSYNSLFVLNENNSKTCLFYNGIWATIIKIQITKQEAEDKFNIEIV